MKRISTLAALLLSWAVAGQAADTGKVLLVIDGDTCQLEDGRMVRYLGMDAPEKGEPHADAAARANNTLASGKTVRLQTGRQTLDRNGRALAYVFVGETLINAELLRYGHAYVRRPVAAKYKHPFLKAQEEARTAGRGIWANSSGALVVIAKMQARPEEGGKTNLQGEYLVLENRGAQSLDLTGWTLQDEAHHGYLFPNFTLPLGGSVTLRTGLGKNTRTELFWGSRTSIWNDNGDTVFLKDTAGNLVLCHLY